MTRKEFEKETAISVKSIGLNSRGKDYIIKISFVLVNQYPKVQKKIDTYKLSVDFIYNFTSHINPYTQ